MVLVIPETLSDSNCAEDAILKRAQNLAKELELPLGTVADLSNLKARFFLVVSTTGLSFRMADEKEKLEVKVNFESPSLTFRIADKLSQQPIAKAIGARRGSEFKILDTTAGLGTDAFLLASLGCQITLLERNSIVHALLNDGIQRARGSSDSSIVATIRRMELQLAEFGNGFRPAQKYNVVYLDPMFPSRRKSARVKKGMYLLQEILERGLGEEPENALLTQARQLAHQRVVIKRSKGAPYYANQAPTHSYTGRTSRFDVYLNNEL